MKFLQNKQQIEKRIENYWDKRSEDFSKLRRKELSSVNAKCWLDLILKHIPENKPLKILDVGTGAGFFATLLANVGHFVTGIDMSGGMIKEARANLSHYNLKAEFIKMSADKLEFPDNTFDTVISRNLTWTLPDAMEAYKEWQRVLKQGGRLLNFDSDVGKTEFTKKDEQKDVHANIAEEMIDECNNIKANLRISTHKRPKWDVDLLKKIGFKVKFDANINSIVRKDENLIYDNIPMFGIYAEKI